MNKQVKIGNGKHRNKIYQTESTLIGDNGEGTIKFRKLCAQRSNDKRQIQPPEA